MTIKFSNAYLNPIIDKFNEMLKAGKIELRGDMLCIRTETKHGCMIIEDDEQRAMYDKGWEDCLAAQKKIKDAFIPHGYIVYNENDECIDVVKSRPSWTCYSNTDNVDIRPFRFMK